MTVEARYDRGEENYRNMLVYWLSEAGDAAQHVISGEDKDPQNIAEVGDRSPVDVVYELALGMAVVMTKPWIAIDALVETLEMQQIIREEKAVEYKAAMKGLSDHLREGFGWSEMSPYIQPHLEILSDHGLLSGRGLLNDATRLQTMAMLAGRENESTMQSIIESVKTTGHTYGPHCHTCEDRDECAVFAVHKDTIEGDSVEGADD